MFLHKCHYRHPSLCRIDNCRRLHVDTSGSNVFVYVGTLTAKFYSARVVMYKFHCTRVHFHKYATGQNGIVHGYTLKRVVVVSWRTNFLWRRLGLSLLNALFYPPGPDILASQYTEMLSANVPE